MRQTFARADGLRALAALAWLAGAAALALDIAPQWDGIREHGRQGVTAIPLAAACGAILLARRRISSDAIASGLALPAVYVAWAASRAVYSAWHELAQIALLSLAFGSALALGALALAPREDAASRRVAWSGFTLALLTPLVFATMAWSPIHRINAYVTVAPPPPHVFLAAAAAVLALLDLQRGKTRALAWIGVMAAAVMTSPSWGAVSCGCMTCPGPMEWPMRAPLDLARYGSGTMTWVVRPLQIVLSPPGLFTLALAPWALPVWRYLRRA